MVHKSKSISNRLANGVGILNFWQKLLKHPSNSLANDLAKYGNLAKTLPHRAYMATWKRAWQILSLLACCVPTTKIKSSPCLHADYCFFSFCQVIWNSKLLERNCFFTWQIVLGVGKSQDLPSRIWQTFEDALPMFPRDLTCTLIHKIKTFYHLVVPLHPWVLADSKLDREGLVEKSKSLECSPQGSNPHPLESSPHQ